MDLKFSPDVEAYFCYVIAFIAGAFVGVSQIRKRIGRVQGIWGFARTWWLLGIYVAIPIGLFWFLDRSGAINDTSVFAALLVGFGYERIITGGSQIKPPGDLSQFWSPFIAYADRISKAVQDQDARNNKRLAERVIAEIDGQKSKINELEKLAKQTSLDVQALNAKLAAITAKRGSTAADEERVRILYADLLTSPDAHDLLYDKNVIGWATYWLDARKLRSMARLAVLALVAVSVIVVSTVHYFDPEEKAADFYIWRVGKTNSTADDRDRAHRNLAAVLQSKDAAIKDYTLQGLVVLLQRPALPMERVNLVLQIILQNRDALDGKSVTGKLIGSLRADNVDVRMRSNEGLKFLAESCPAIAKDLSDWRPSDGDSVASLERHIKQWTEYWAKSCPPKST